MDVIIIGKKYSNGDKSTFISTNKSDRYTFAEDDTSYRLERYTKKQKVLGVVLMILGIIVTLNWGINIPYGLVTYGLSGFGIGFLLGSSLVTLLGIFLLRYGIKYYRKKELITYMKQDYTKQEDEGTIHLIHGNEEIVLVKLNNKL